ncbi:hypothetical protein MMC10_004146 [Thelotrema lepadinum]|nr:hypothetical protein [Thelotrema lepadinum]
MAWFWRGFQSAVFYYLSCAPCMTYAHQRKRAKANRRAKAIKSAQTQTEGIYIHPSPFDTNIYWHEEMILGPGPPQRKGNKDRNKTDSTRRLNTSGQGSSAEGSSVDSTLVVHTFDGVREDEEYEEDGWNKKRYQRVDEFLWGEDDPSAGSYLSLGSSAASKPIIRSAGTFYGSRNPAVNDLHPPVVSTHPTNPNQTRWMLQPPPPARIMEGKERASRSRSTSTASYNNSSRGTGGAMAGSQLSMKRPTEFVKENLVRNAQEDIGSLREFTGQHHGRKPEPSDDLVAPSPSPSKRRRPPPIRITNESPNGTTARTKIAKARPKLTTIKSSENAEPQPNAKNLPRSAASSTIFLDPRSAILPSASSSLQALQELFPTGSASNAQAHSPTQEACVRLPTATEAEERFLALPEIDSKFPGGDSFHFPEAHLKSQDSEPDNKDKHPIQRWSMDL